MDLSTARKQALQFITDNKKAVLTAVICILILSFFLVIAALYYRNAQTSALEASKDPNYLVLPEKVRTPEVPAANLSVSSVQPRDPFTGPMVLKGIIQGGKGGGLAIIEVNGTTFIAEEGSSVAGSWMVTEVRSNLVILVDGEQRLQLEFGGKMTTNKLETNNQSGGEVTSGDQ
jgi:hypothetical protein